MILGLIPARGGSKGIPRKNIKEICGKPLIAWTIEAALRSQLMNQVVVSTDDKEIADISRDIETESGVLRGLMAAIDFERARIEATKSGGAGPAAVVAGLDMVDKLYKHPIVRGAIDLGRKVFTGVFKSMKGKHNKISALDQQIKNLSGVFWGLKKKVADARSTLSKLKAM